MVDMSPLGQQSPTLSTVQLTETSAQKHDTLRYDINVQLLHTLKKRKQSKMHF